MAAGIRMADAVHTVSPSYAEEILTPSRKPRRFSGGEGLEEDLQAAKKENRLFGILNGCDYPETRPTPVDSFQEFLTRLRDHTLRWSGTARAVAAAHFLAYARLTELDRLSERPTVILTGIGRVVAQKVMLLREAGTDGKSGLQAILEALGQRGLYIFLGEGDPAYEQFMTEMSARFENFVFLNGYSDECAGALYAHGDLFLMPSSFEPCGIGQMLAMRDGQPCVVHAVGGLKDTVEHGVTGFRFSGDTVAEQIDHFVQTTLEAIDLKRQHPETWENIRQNASSSRFRWKDSLQQYIEKLYTASGSK
jgi:starch synthase